MNVFIIHNGSTYEVTKIISDLSWSYELDTVAGTLEFSIASEFFTLGDIISVQDGNYEVFRGVLVNESGRKIKSFTCMDYGWYLTRNEILIQFRNVTAYDAILRISNKHNFLVELPKNLNKSVVTKIYKDETIADIYKDLLDNATAKTNNKYYMRMFGNVLAIRTYHREVIPVYGVKVDYDKSRSIENMANKVVIVAGEEDSERIYAEALDNKNISKYGLLQTMETIDADDKNKASNVAKNRLNELNKIDESISFSCIGNKHIVPGRIIYVHNDELKGEYLVKEVTHNYVNDENYFCDLTVERWTS